MLGSRYVENCPFCYLGGSNRMLVNVPVISDVYVSVLVLRGLKLTGTMLFHLVEPGQLPKHPGLPGANHCSDPLLARTGAV